jgi:redox-sensitive bicupin YhaK (pirin superfamily)
MNEIQVLHPKLHDLGGGFTVRRLLPSALRQAVGPFLFFDHFGPVIANPGDNHDVRPHPHIGLATLTYLFEGAMMHRDSTGVVQRIEPGAVNWMTAGRGIVHSERTPDDLRNVMRRSHGLQLWIAIPAEHEEDAPSFSHTPATDIPTIDLEGATVRVLVGSAFGHKSPVQTLSPTVYLDLQLRGGASVRIEDVATERALYAIDGPFSVDGQSFEANTLVVLPEANAVTVQSDQANRIVLVGGAPLGHRFIVWNFVSSRKERIVQAQDDWGAQRFDTVPGETEFIPLPERKG